MSAATVLDLRRQCQKAVGLFLTVAALDRSAMDYEGIRKGLEPDHGPGLDCPDHVQTQ